MRYMLVNVSPGSLQVDLLSPEIMHNSQSLHRPGPVVALSIPRGHSIDILPHFNGDIEKAHASVKYSRDTLKFLRPNMLSVHVCDDHNKKVDIDALLGGHYAEPVEEPVEPPAHVVDDPPVVVDDPPADDPPADDPDATRPDMGEGAVIAAVDQHEAEMTGEASTEPVEPTTEATAEETTEATAEETTEATAEETTEATAEETTEEAKPAVTVPDNMTAMKHVGDALELKLYEAGLTTYAAVAEADDKILDEIIGHKAKDVRKQAKKLAK